MEQEPNSPPIVDVPEPSHQAPDGSDWNEIETGFDVRREANGNLVFETNDPEGKVTTSMKMTLDLALRLRDWLYSHYPVG